MHIGLNYIFQLWDYNVSHKQLLLRCPKSDDMPENIDIICWGVEGLTIETRIVKPHLCIGTPAERERVLSQLATPSCDGILFVLETQHRRFYIYAHGCKVLANSLDIFESSLEYFRPDDKPLDRGRILYHSQA